jgi:DNA-binding transcriptional LysR family regulator
MSDVDLRKLRYFVAVAEQLHFGRAAALLHIAQPVLSRQIRALEDELKVELFVRTKRATELTPAGRQLLADAVPLLTNAAALQRRVRRAAGGTDSFTVAFMPGLTVTAAVRAMRDSHPGLSVDVLRTDWDDQGEVLRDGRADVGYVRLPLDRRGLTVQPLTTEPRVAVVPSDHPLAGKDEIAIGDLAGATLLQNPAAVPEWQGRAVPVPAASVEEKLEHVAAGRGVAVLPLSTAAFYTRADVAYARITDISANTVCLAWASDRDDNPLLRDFAALVSALSPA